MKKLTILSILLCLVMSTVKAQLIDYTYNSDNSGIAFNEVTRITIDEKRDLIWLTHYTSNNSNGLSVARLNSHNTAPPFNPFQLLTSLQLSMI